MAEQVIVTEAKPETQVTQEIKTEVTQPKPEVDLITRVSQVKPSETQVKKEEEGKFNINDLDTEIEKIQDPALKEQMVRFKKSLLSGENQKYQEIANLRKQYETKLVEVSNWTPERLKSELAKPDFVQAAQTVLQSGNQQGLTNEQYSALSDGEKAEFNQQKQDLLAVKKQTWEILKSQQDAVLKNKYANYNPASVDNLLSNLFSGRISDLEFREGLFKYYDYEAAVQRAYELGRQDKITENTEKIGGMTFEGGRNITTPTSVERQKGETIQNFMRRSYQEHTKKK